MKPIKACLLSVSGFELTSFEKRLLHQANPVGVTLFKRNIQSPEQVRRLVQSIKAAIERENVLIAVDQEGGRVSRFEVRGLPFLAQRAIGGLPPEKAEEVTVLHGHLMGDLLKSAGINVNFAPCLDVANAETASVLKSRCFSDNEKTVARLGQLLIDVYLKKGILPCMKHLPGHGRVHLDPHLHLPTVTASLKMLQKDFYPFQQAALSCPLGMTAHIVLSSVDPSAPVTQSSKAIREIIRNEIGFRGFLISDAVEMRALSGSLSEKTQKALEAGCDAVCYCLGNADDLIQINETTPFLTDKSFERFLKVLDFFNQKREETPVAAAEKYLSFVKEIPPIPEDYDAVEVLNELSQKTPFMLKPKN